MNRIIVDVDETLLHRTTSKLPNLIPDYILNINNQNLYIYLRNNSTKFLKLLSGYFEYIYIYSASNITILKKLFDELDWSKYVKNIWGYDSCYKYFIQNSIGSHEVYKTIQKIKQNGNFSNTDKIHIIDDRPKVYCDLDKNCIMYNIFPFNGYNNDNSLEIIFYKIMKNSI
jgi:hypothetical protein